jgi:hypothetical protein
MNVQGLIHLNYIYDQTISGNAMITSTPIFLYLHLGVCTPYRPAYKASTLNGKWLWCRMHPELLPELKVAWQIFVWDRKQEIQPSIGNLQNWPSWVYIE